MTPALSGGAPALDDAAKSALTDRMTRAWPGSQLASLVAMGADAVAEGMSRETLAVGRMPLAQAER